MKKSLLLLPLLILWNLVSLTAQDYVITVQNFAYTPADLTINVGETVEWQNMSGTHNANGSQATFPDNPASFFSGAPSSAAWTYSFTFNTPGTYEYRCDQHPGSMTGTITVLGGYPMYDIATVTTVDGQGVTDSLDVECELQGIVYGGDLRGGDGVEFTLHDGTGGIKVFNFDLAYYDVTEGDELIVRGTIDQFSGLTQIVPDTIIEVSAGNPLPAPVIVTALDEGTESELIQIDNLSLVDPLQWTNSGSGFNVDVTNGLNTFVMRIDNDVDLYDEPAPAGTFNLIGIGGQFDGSSPYDDGYQILPRSTEDLMPVMGNDPVLFFDNEGVIVDESAGTLQIPVTIEGGNENPTSVTVIVSSGSNAVEGEDFLFPNPIILTFPADVATETQFVTTEIIDDMDPENTELAAFALVSPTNNATILPSGLLYGIEINDNDGGLLPDLILTAVFDGPLTGGQPKGVEIFVAQDIPDLSIYGIGSANNGQGSDGEEFTFPAVSATAGQYLYLTPEPIPFEAFFGFAPDFEDTEGATNINGDDAVELFKEGGVIDVFGDINVDGSGEPWEYLDSWAYRVSGTGPDGSTFILDNWLFGGVDALDGANTNDEAGNPVPIGTYMISNNVVVANDDAVSVDQDGSVSFNVLDNDILPNGPGSGVVVTIEQPDNGMLSDFGGGEYVYFPDAGYCGPDSFVYEVCDNGILSCDTATVNITVECPVTYPPYDIGTVTTVDGDGNLDSLGVSCQLQGIVHGVDLQVDDPIQFTLIDATGGLSLFSSDDFGYTVQEGDELIIQGDISEFNCLAQITPVSIQFVSSGNDLVEAPVVTELNESTESELVRINNVIPLDPDQWDNSGSGMNIDVEDDLGNTYLVRIDDAVDLYSMPIPPFPWDVIGLGGQFDNDGQCDEGYQLLPRYMEDIISLVSTDEADLSNLIRVFPNPASEELFWQTDLRVEHIVLYDQLGRDLVQQFGDLRSLPVADLPGGLYFLHFQTAEGLHTERVIIR